MRLFDFNITIVHGGQRQHFKSQHRSGGEALAEICEALGIVFPTHASIVRQP